MDYVSIPDYANNFINWANVAAFEPDMQESHISHAARKIQTISAGAPDFFEVKSGPEAPTAFPASKHGAPSFRSPTGIVGEGASRSGSHVDIGRTTDEVERIANQRVKLLAVKYASSEESKEIVARLEILNRRLLDRSPRVSADQVQGLEDAAAQLSMVRKSREDRMRRLGIKA
jgi:hypothetical protein